jgi:N-methylhydantoinase B
MVDTVELELFRAMVISVFDEIEHNLTRTAFSPMIYDYKDYCVGFLSPEFKLVASSRYGSPMFVADLGPPVADAVEQIGRDELVAGDVFITNYAAVQGQHLNNVVMAAPLFEADVLIGYVAIRAHWTDVGGMAPTSMSWDATEIYQEGVQYRGLRIARAGVLQGDVLATVIANTRFKEYLAGDIQAQFGACMLAQRRWDERIANRWSAEEIRSLWATQMRRSAEVAAAAIRRLPDGSARVSCVQDDSGRPGTSPLTLVMTVSKRGDRIVVDMSEMPPQVAGPINTGATAGGVSMCRLAYKSLIAPDYPLDEALFDALEIVLPPGTLLSAGEGAPMGWWNNSLAIVGDLFTKAIGQWAPDLVPASHHGAMNIGLLSGRRPDGTWWTLGGALGGGWGASHNSDGFSNLFTNHHGDHKEDAAELLEARFPVRVLSRRLLPGSAGRGRHVGGYGTERTLVVDTDAFISTAMDRTHEPPWGLNGGEPGTCGRIDIKYPDGRSEPATKVTGVPVPPGTILRVRTGGGGGWGHPDDRPLTDLADDERSGLVGSAETHPQGGESDPVMAPTAAGPVED